MDMDKDKEKDNNKRTGQDRTALHSTEQSRAEHVPLDQQEHMLK